MQFKTLLYSAIVATVAAESLQDLVNKMPQCATTCIKEASPKIGCGETDNKCQCGKLDDLSKATLPCISAGCSSDEMQSALKISSQICAKVAGGDAGDKASSAADKASSAADKVTSAVASATGAAGSAVASKANEGASKLTASATSVSETAKPSAAGAAHNFAGMGLAAAAVAFAL